MSTGGLLSEIKCERKNPQSRVSYLIQLFLIGFSSIRGLFNGFYM